MIGIEDGSGSVVQDGELVCGTETVILVGDVFPTLWKSKCSMPLGRGLGTWDPDPR